MEQLLPQKEQMVEILLSSKDAGLDRIGIFEEKLQRNHMLLDSSLGGIRSVAARLAALQQVRTALDTYDARGRKRHVLTPGKSKIEKRA